MTVLDAAILGLVQGATEFLPVSSSGHLVLFQKFLETGPESFTLDIFLHFATLFAVVIFFWKDLWSLRIKDIIPLVIASVPAAAAGILLKDQLEALFASGATIGWELLITAAINFWSDRLLSKQTTGTTEISWKTAGWVGIAQATAILPAISRSGTTVWTALLRGVDRTAAFRFSFLLSIPVILGANLFEVLDIYQSGQSLPDTGILVAGGLTAFIVGFLSLFLLRYMIKQAKFEFFGWYCAVLGCVVLGIQFFG